MIPTILNRFRWENIGVVADIKQAFLQISLNENDRDVLRFMWWKGGDSQQLITYRHCRVVFGILGSPFLLAVLNRVLDQAEEPLKGLAMKLKDSFYVDNCVTSIDSFAGLEYFKRESQKILKAAKFDSRGWKNNYLPEIEDFFEDSSAYVDENDGKVTCQLIQARSRIAPLKELSIPRIELLACPIEARLTNAVKKDLKLEKIQLKISIYPITWKFIPPATPWWGGFWERLIGILKRILENVLGRASLNYQEMETVLCDCENQLNSTPLTYISEDPEDLNALTTDLFLKENPLTTSSNTTDFDKIKTTSKDLKKRLVYRRKLMSDLRVRFRNEYLGHLHQRTIALNRFYVPNVGDLIWTDNLKRLYWPLGRILSIYTSNDRVARTTKVKTKPGLVTRPSKDCVL
ncbi:hypothetical protein X975_24273, partial [Stegodyphus mimosarum]